MRTLIAAVLVLAVCTPLASARTWADSTGKHTVEAEFVEFKDGKVQLKKEDGKTITIPIERLSDPDQEYVRTLKPAKEGGEGNRRAKDDDQAGDKAALAKSTIGVLVFREDGYAGAPVKKLEEWLNMPLADNFGKLYDDAALKKVVNTKLADLQVQVLSEHKKTLRETLDERQEFVGIIVLYLNSGSLAARMVQPGQYLGDNMYVTRRNGASEFISRKEHKDFGPAAPKWATGTFYSNYYGAECCFFLRGSNKPDAHSLAVDQNQTPKPGQPSFGKLLESALDKGVPQVKAVLRKSPALTQGEPAGLISPRDFEQQRGKESQALRLVGTATVVTAEAAGSAEDVVAALSLADRLANSKEKIAAWLPQMKYGPSRPKVSGFLIITSEKPTIASVRRILGQEDQQEQGHIELAKEKTNVTWHKFGWLHFGVVDGAVRVLRARL